MNASPMTVTAPSTSASQGQASNAKSSDTPVDTPFSQVFSGELARKASEASEGTAPDDDRDELATEALAGLMNPTSRIDYPGIDATAAGATADTAAGATAGAAADATADAVADAVAKIAAEAAEKATAVAADAAPADALVRPDMLLALAAAAEGLKSAAQASAGVPVAGDGHAAALPTDVLSSKGAAATQPASQAPDGSVSAAPVAPARGVRPAGVAVAAEAMAGTHAAEAEAVAFSERLASARQSDPANAGERLAELMSNPGLRAPAPSAPAAASAPVDPSSRLAPSVGTAAWGQALGEKLVWMAAGNQQTASITLNPPNLGPLQIVVNVSNDQATANFFAAQPEVRQAIESAFPKLREMMNEAGIQLGQTTVSAETPRQQDAPQRETPRGAPGFAEGGNRSADPVVQHTVPLRQGGRGLVDTFA